MIGLVWLLPGYWPLLLLVPLLALWLWWRTIGDRTRRDAQLGANGVRLVGRFGWVRLRTGAARRFKRTDHAVAILWKLLMIAEGTFKTYDSVHLLTDVAAGTEFADGLPLKAPQSHVA